MKSKKKTKVKLENLNPAFSKPKTNSNSYPNFEEIEEKNIIDLDLENEISFEKLK